MNTTQNLRNSVCRYVPIVPTHKSFAGLYNACRIFIRTNGFLPSLTNCDASAVALTKLTVKIFTLFLTHDLE